MSIRKSFYMSIYLYVYPLKLTTNIPIYYFIHLSVCLFNLPIHLSKQGSKGYDN